jgi:hypothetical protein
MAGGVRAVHGLLLRSLASIVGALVFAGTSIWAAAATGTESHEQSSSDVLHFLDGGFLHGKLMGMEPGQGIHWAYPESRETIRFRPGGVDGVKFEGAGSHRAWPSPTCRIQFGNGDEILGELTSVDEDGARFRTWFGGDLIAPRENLSALTFFPAGYEMVYDGPNGVDGWQLQNGSRGWNYEDGAFVAEGVGILGRDLKLSDSAALEFDLAWNGRFSLSFIMYTDAIDRFDYSINSYMFHLTPGYVSLQRVQVGAGVISIGPQTQIPDMLSKSRSRLKIQVDKSQASITLWMDGQLVRRWKDPGGFVAKGTGVVFSSQMEGPTVKISNVQVSRWNGMFEVQAPPTEPLKQDLVYLGNSDKVTGRVQGVRDGRLRVMARRRSLEIPLARVNQVFFAQSGASGSEAPPWEVRAELAGGGAVVLELEEWNRERVSGRSENFGSVVLKPESIRQVRFNASKTQPLGESTSSNEEIWDADE